MIKSIISVGVILFFTIIFLYAFANHSFAMWLFNSSVQIIMEILSRIFSFFKGA